MRKLYTVCVPLSCHFSLRQYMIMAMSILYSASLSFSVEMCALERLEYKKYITKSNRMKLRLYEETMLQMVDGRHSFLMKTQGKVSITRILI